MSGCLSVHNLLKGVGSPMKPMIGACCHQVVTAHIATGSSSRTRNTFQQRSQKAEHVFLIEPTLNHHDFHFLKFYLFIYVFWLR